MTESESPEVHDRMSPGEAQAFMFSRGLRENLNHYVRFHNVLKGCLGQIRQEPDLQEDPGALHTLEIYEKLNAANTLLLSLAYLEEMLILFWRRVLPKRPLPVGSSIDRYKPVFEELRLDLGTLESWTMLNDATAIRHCLLHTNGRISFMRNADKIRAVVYRNEGLEVVLGDRIRVTPMFLKRTVAALNSLREEMLEAKERMQI